MDWATKMIDWTLVNTRKIRKIGYNAELKVLHIEFNHSIIDTPYINVPKKVFLKMLKEKNVDAFYENKIRSVYTRLSYIDKAMLITTGNSDYAKL